MKHPYASSTVGDEQPTYGIITVELVEFFNGSDMTWRYGPLGPIAAGVMAKCGRMIHAHVRKAKNKLWLDVRVRQHQKHCSRCRKVKELQRCKNDPAYYIRKYLKTDAQKAAFTKARQLGGIPR